MKIQTASTNLLNIIPIRTNVNNNSNISFDFNNGLNSDIISFSSKKYDSDSIKNPTNHCAYCGCKVYTEKQLESIAKEMLQLKSERLQGKIKSILEKLDGAKYSEEIELAKRMENSEEIEFFKKFLDISIKKTFLKGDAILEQMYPQMSEDELTLLTKNMHPLLRTIDHVSPQNRKEENTHADINLVEACYCCNHDLKKGMSFSEFHTMFPSIERNMPKDKFQYAAAGVLANGQSGVNQRLSADNILKSFQRLLLQREAAVNNLKSIDYRIDGLKAQIDDSIENIRKDIQRKRNEISELEEKLIVLSQDSEFCALQTREYLMNFLVNTETAISALRERWQNTSIAINQIRNPQKNHKKNKSQQKSEQENTEQKIAELKQILENLSLSIKTQEDNRSDILSRLEKLNSEFPPMEKMQTEKQKLEAVLSVFSSLKRERKNLEEKEKLKNEIDAELKIKETEMINVLRKKISSYEVQVCEYDEVEAIKELNLLNEKIKRISKKENDLKIPRQIKSLEAEISILEQTISDLTRQKNQKFQFILVKN